MGVPCDICKAHHCACEGPVCGYCQSKINEINENPNLSGSQKVEEINKLFLVSN